MKNKIARKILLSAMVLATAFSPMTASAQSSENEEEVVAEVNQDGMPFSVTGNGQLLDDITDDSTKQFITVQTKNNQTFFMVIDRAQTTENVYMLSLIDEDDLSEFLDDADAEGLGVILPEAEAQPDAAVETNEVTENAESATETKDNSTALYMLIIVIFAIAIGGGYYIKIYKPKKEAEEDRDEGIEDDFDDEAEESEESEDSEEEEYEEDPDDEGEDLDESSKDEDEDFEDGEADEYELDEEIYEEDTDDVIETENDPDETTDEFIESEETEEIIDSEEDEEILDDTESNEEPQEVSVPQPKKTKRAHGRKNRMKYQGR